MSTNPSSSQPNMYREWGEFMEAYPLPLDKAQRDAFIGAGDIVWTTVTDVTPTPTQQEQRALRDIVTGVDFSVASTVTCVIEDAENIKDGRSNARKFLHGLALNCGSDERGSRLFEISVDELAKLGIRGMVRSCMLGVVGPRSSAQ
jgi:hypothetical protein